MAKKLTAKQALRVIAQTLGYPCANNGCMGCAYEMTDAASIAYKYSGIRRKSKPHSIWFVDGIQHKVYVMAEDPVSAIKAAKIGPYESLSVYKTVWEDGVLQWTGKAVYRVTAKEDK